MKFKNRLKMGIIFLATVVTCDSLGAQDVKKQAKPLEYRILKAKLESNELYFPGDAVRVLPPKAGISADVPVYVSGLVHKVELYQNKKKIATKLNIPPSRFGHVFNVKNHIPGDYTYHAIAYDNKGNALQSWDAKAEFTGQLLDYKPVLAPRGGCYYDYNKGGIVVWSRDYGDNKGITNMQLFEDGKPLPDKKFNDVQRAEYFHKIPWIHAQKHDYHVNVIDRAENISTGLLNLLTMEIKTIF